MIDRSTNIREALRKRQRGFIINPFRFGIPAPSDPSEIASLVAWWDAQDSGTITHSGGEISQWDDKSGNGWNVTQATASRKPNNLTSANFGSNNVVEFDGGDWLAIETATGFPINGAVASTMILVARQSANDGAAHRAFSYGTSTSGSIVMRAIGAGNSTGGYWSLGTEASTGFNSTAAESTNAGIYINTLVDAGANRAYAHYLDGSAAGSGTTAYPLSTASNARLCIGKTSYTSSGVHYWVGEIAEIQIYSGVLTTVERQAMEGYLAHKWGLAGNLLGGHPWKSAPPP